MKPISLEVQSFLRLTSAFIEFPDTGTLVIGGKNAQGKTSAIEAIAAALGGKPDYQKPVHDGKDTAQIVLTTDQFTVTRRFTQTDTRLEIHRADGGKITRPQEFLNSFFSTLSFDPCAFLRMTPRDQVRTLADLLGLDFAALDAEHKSVFEERTIVNREWEKLKAHAGKLPFHPDAPATEQSAADLADKLQEHAHRQTANDKLRADLDAARRDYDRADAALEADRKRLAELEAEVARLAASTKEQEAHLEELLEAGRKLGAEVAALVDPDPQEVDQVKAAMRDVERANARTRDNQRRAVAMQEAEDKAAESAGLTKRLAEIEAQKRRLIAAAPFPVEGMSFSDDGEGVTFGGVPLNQASSAEQLRVSCAMGFALNPQCRLLLVRDGSLLDDDSLALVQRLAEEHQGQVVIERVGKGEEVDVVIEDGEVSERRGEIVTAKPVAPEEASAANVDFRSDPLQKQPATAIPAKKKPF